MAKVYAEAEAFDLRFLAARAQETLAAWDRLTAAQRASGAFIDPDAPVLVRVVTREAALDEADEEDDEWAEDAAWHEALLELFSVGGDDHHQGFTLTARKRA